MQNFLEELSRRVPGVSFRVVTPLDGITVPIEALNEHELPDNVQLEATWMTRAGGQASANTRVSRRVAAAQPLQLAETVASQIAPLLRANR